MNLKGKPDKLASFCCLTKLEYVGVFVLISSGRGRGGGVSSWVRGDENPFFAGWYRGIPLMHIDFVH